MLKPLFISPPQGQRVVTETRETRNGSALSVWQRVLCYAIFFLSGAAALIYQISWSRQIGLLFGNTVDAAAVVLASYFSGMALGYFIGAKWSSRLSPLLGYGVAEVTVAAWACLFPALLDAVSSPLVGPWVSSTSYGLQTAARVVFAIAALLPATTALGVTLPLMAEFLSSQPIQGFSGQKRGDGVALAYAINTFGAVAGVMSSVVLLPVVGVRTSSYVAAGASFACAITAGVLGWGRAASASRNAEASGVRADLRRLPSPSWIAIAALSGFGTLALEVLYTRMFSLVFHNSTYTFAAVVAAFLMSLAIGAALVAWLQPRFRTESLAAGAAVFGALATMFSVSVFVALTRLDYFAGGESFLRYLSGAFLLVVVVVGPPTVSLGMLLPLVWKAADFRHGAGEVVGRLSAINTIAAACGALTASFLLLPTVGLWGSFVLVAALFFLAGAGLIVRTTTVRSRCAGVAVFGALAFLTLRSPVEAERSHMQRGEQIMRRWLSPYGWVDVVRLAGSGSFKVRLNLHYRFGETGRDTREYRQAHIPLLLHERPDDVLFLGLGMGLTASGALSHDEVKKVVAVELIPEVVEAARYLADHNQRVVDHPKVEVQIDDARHYLLAANRRFDVIISDLFVPWDSQSGYLYTIDHYRRAQHRLKPGGLFCQWIPLYQVGTREFELIADSFAHVFPVTTIWWGDLDPARPVVALIGSERALECDSLGTARRLAELRETTGLADDYFASVDGLYNNYVGDWPARATSLLNSDEHPRLEFMTPVSVRDRKMVQRLTLQSYFDQVLSRLPSGSDKLNPGASSPSSSVQERRAWQRFILFGKPSP